MNIYFEKLIGLIFISISILLAISYIGLFPFIFENILKLFYFTIKKFDVYEISEAIGSLSVFVIQFFIMIFLYKKGSKLLKIKVN